MVKERKDKRCMHGKPTCAGACTVILGTFPEWGKGGVSDRGNHNVGSGWGIQAESAAIDFDHALLSMSLAEQFEFATGQKAKVGHSGTGSSVSVDGADTKTLVATGLRKWGARLRHPMAAFFTASTSGEEIGEEKTGSFRLIFRHEHNKRLLDLVSSIVEVRRSGTVVENEASWFKHSCSKVAEGTFAEILPFFLKK